jgi:hypothetical protein
MTHAVLRRQAIELRSLGKSYNQIRDLLKVNKSTLSGWLRQYPLTEKQQEALKGNIAHRIEKYRQTMQQKREIKLLHYYHEAKRSLLPLSKKELLIAGLFLYWGEGGKTEKGQAVIANTDPALMQFALLWMTQGLGISKKKIHILIHLYTDMDIEESLNYWSNLLDIPRSQFSKPYIKNSRRASVDYKGYGHGTCNIRIFKSEIKDRIMMSIKALGDYSHDSVLKV